MGKYQEPYITYENKYIESVWWLLKQAFDKGLIYGYLPLFSYGKNGLSSHELNQPGCYKDVKDTSVTAQFLIEETGKKVFNSKKTVFFLAWTTTPWTLPSNTALAVNKNIQYVLVETINQYTKTPVAVVVAEKLSQKFSAPLLV